jgi:succinoglycan biosynthesis transport protein ExoP
VFRLNEVLRAVRAGRWAIIVGLLTGLALAGALSATTVRTYVSSTELFVTVPRTPDAPSAYQGSLFTRERMDSYARLLTTSQLAQEVVDDTGIPLTADQVVGKVTAVPVPNTDILEITVNDTTPERAQAIADSLGRQFTEQVAELETSDAQGPTIQVRTIEPATFEPTATPALSRYLALGAALGLLAGLAFALVRQRLDGTIRSNGDAQRATGTALVSRVYENDQLSKLPESGLLEESSPMTKAFRALRLNLEHAGGASRPQVVVVTSAAPEDGKSTVAVGLSVSLSRSGSRVLLVEGNLWRPRLTRYLGLAASDRGLTDVLAGTADVQEVSLSSNDSRLTVLPAGPMPEDPGEILGSKEMHTLLQGLREAYDYIVIDTPALLPLVDGAALSALADGVLLVTRYGRTQRDELTEAATAIAAVDARLLGVVLNRVPVSVAPPAERQEYRADSGRTKTARAVARGGRRRPPVDDQEPDVLSAGSGRT